MSQLVPDANPPAPTIDVPKETELITEEEKRMETTAEEIKATEVKIEEPPSGRQMTFQVNLLNLVVFSLLFILSSLHCSNVKLLLKQ